MYVQALLHPVTLLIQNQMCVVPEQVLLWAQQEVVPQEEQVMVQVQVQVVQYWLHLQPLGLLRWAHSLKGGRNAWCRMWTGGRGRQAPGWAPGADLAGTAGTDGKVRTRSMTCDVTVT